MLRAFLACGLVVSTGMLAASCFPLKCSEVGCESSLNVSLHGILTKFAGDMPLTIHVCPEQGPGLCFPVTVTSVGPGKACPDSQPGPDCCTFDPSEGILTCDAGGGDVSIMAPVLDPSASDGSMETILVTVQDQSGKVLFSDQQTTALGGGFSPNGEACGPTCYSGAVTFVSQ